MPSISVDKEVEEEDEEALILAKVGTTVANAATYEEKVIRETVDKDTPRLSGVGFPDLSNLLHNCGTGATATTTTSILTRLACKMGKEVMQQYDKETRSINVLRVKYQMLQSFLSTMNYDNNRSSANNGSKKNSVLFMDVDRNKKDEIAAEKNRSAALKAASSNNRVNNNTIKSTSKEKHQMHDASTTKKQISLSTSSFLTPTQTLELAKKGLLPNADKYDNSNNKLSCLGKQALLNSSLHTKSTHKRQSIMERKRKLNGSPPPTTSDNDAGTDHHYCTLDDQSKLLPASTISNENFLNHLRELRKQRKDSRRQRKQKSCTADISNISINDSTIKKQHHIENDPIVYEPCPNSNSYEYKNSSRSTDSTLMQIKEDFKEECLLLVCPVCNGNVKYTSSCIPDEVLSIHIDQCQKKNQSSRRTTRSRVRSYNSSSITAGESPKSYSKRQKTNGIHGSPLFDDDLGQDGSVVEEYLEPGICETRNKKRKTATETFDGNSKNNTKTIRSCCKDDLELWEYEDRVNTWIESGVSNMVSLPEQQPSSELPGGVFFPGGLTIPAWINNRLFPYQRSALRWLWELYKQKSGSILGDEMGLGKTVQVASFLGSMILSRKLDSILLVSPATMLDHWLRELAIWAPGLRRILIHKSAEYGDGFSREVSSALLKKLDKWLTRARSEFFNEPLPRGDDDSLDITDDEEDTFCGNGYVVITTYENLRKNVDIWSKHHWGMVVIDEGQKIKNPDADVTLACKRIRTPHRLLVTATPISNDLVELWSLFDFVVPGRLGTLPSFESEFAEPIKRGGYANASPMQVQLSYRCALVVRDLVNPYMLRRLKKDIEEVQRLPSKTEHILFCRLTDRQRILYEAYLESDEMKRILEGSLQCFKAITVLRKICNHPDLVCNESKESFRRFVGHNCKSKLDNSTDDDSNSSIDTNNNESVVESCGKLIVLAKILPLWKRQGHRVLIFCQWKKMLNILQRFMVENGWKFARLDGNTCVGSRQALVDKFNNDTSYFAMLLTTRTGGVGLNLVGANRCILWDPDWNPQVDAQARERSYRFGQTKEVTVYRMITAGTIEEKIYHRQIFKTALSERVLQDPKQRRMFSQRDLKDLFTLKTNDTNGEKLSETVQLMKANGVVKPCDSNDDRSDLGALLRSKGLAFVFDHDTVGNSSSLKNKTRVDIEMEEKAKEAAERARIAIGQSSYNNQLHTQSSTECDLNQPVRFGPKTQSNTVVSHSSGSMFCGDALGKPTVAAGSQDHAFGQHTTVTSANVLAKLRNRLC